MDKFFLTGFGLLLVGAVCKYFLSALIPSFVLTIVFYAAILMFIIGIARKGGGPC
ncbi:MAG: hypothetical protein Q4A41_04735 [Bacillota bacterium]|nr:hypothetical protein [Bacillota bacterium]